MFRAIEELFIRHAAAINDNEPPRGALIARMAADQLVYALGDPVPWDQVLGTPAQEGITFSGPPDYAVTLAPGYVWQLECRLGVSFSNSGGEFYSRYMEIQSATPYGFGRLLSESSNVDRSYPRVLGAIFAVGPEQAPLEIQVVSTVLASFVSLLATESSWVVQKIRGYTTPGLVVIA
jgi:hypothetical protein